MISRDFEARSEAPFRTPAQDHGARRLDTIGSLQPLAGLMLAAGFVLSIAGRYEGQLIRAERIQQEVIGR